MWEVKVLGLILGSYGILGVFLVGGRLVGILEFLGILGK